MATAAARADPRMSDKIVDRLHRYDNLVDCGL
jgi:hypothetical protein